MDFKPTPDQQRVIDSRNKSLLVAAAAGSGKTAVLVERIIRLISEGDERADIDRMLIVTFTRAAAAQMKQKIYEAIQKKLIKEGPDPHLEKQLLLVNHANICTIDSFCSGFIREHYNEAGVSPDFRVADEVSLQLMKQEVLDRVFDSAFRAEDPGFIRLCDSFVSRDNIAGLKKMVLSIYEQSQSYPMPEKWIESLEEPFTVESIEDLKASPWMIRLNEDIGHHLSALVKETRSLADYAERILPTDGNTPHPYMAALLEDAVGLEYISGLSDDEKLSAFLGFGFATLSRAKSGFEDTEQKEDIKGRRDEIKNQIKKLQEMVPNPEEELAVMKDSRIVAKALIDLALSFSREFLDRKLKDNQLSFSDIEHFALYALVDKDSGEPTPLSGLIREQYSHVMVDEYQDSNDLQEMLLLTISGESIGRYNYFMVGDVKQSIYRFRKARPGIFMGKYRDFKEDGKNKELITLSANFRSRKSVTDFVNRVFEQLMHDDIGEIEYDEDNRLVFGAAYYSEDETGNSPSCYICCSDDEIIKEAGIDSVSLEAMMIADIIEDTVGRQMVTGKDGNLRPCTYSDIVILHQKANSVSDKFMKVFNSRGIPVYMTGLRGYFESFEIDCMISMLSILDNPLNDIALCTVLKGIYGMDEDELARIRIKGREGGRKPFSEMFIDVAKSETSVGRTAEILEEIEKLRDDIIKLSVTEIMLTVIERTGFRQIIATMENPDKRIRNLERLLGMAVDFENNSRGGLYSFVSYLGDLKKFDIDYGTAPMDAVDSALLMTIHKSKGLEFPVCILAGCGVSHSKSESNVSLVISEDFGIGFDMVDRSRSLKVKSAHKKALKRFESSLQVAERQRLLYVALTRAKEKLIITASMKDKDILRAMDENKKELLYSDRFKADCFMDMMAPALKKWDYHLERIEAGRFVERRSVELAARDLKTQEADVLLINGDSEDVKNLMDAFNYSYPVKAARILKAKYSVSEIKSMQSAKEEDTGELFTAFSEDEKPVPEFLKGSKKESGNPLVRGTAVHRFMECLDLNSEKDLKSQLSYMKEKGLLTEEQAPLIDLEKMKLFMESELCKRMAAADMRGELYRERTFVMACPTRELFPGQDYGAPEEGDTTLVQGIIDACFIEDGKFILLDYKTDKVNNEKELSDRYESQLKLYKRALFNSTAIPVEAMYIYAVETGKTITV